MKKVWIFLFVLASIYANKQQMQPSYNPELPTVAIILTGGTILQKTDPKTGASVPAANPQDIIDAIPELKKIANLKVIGFSNLDSSQMTPRLWTKLSKVVDETLEDPEIIGAVVVHGTDTMADGAFFLDVTLKTEKNVVFTGAMANASSPFSDGPLNLVHSIIQVTSPNAKHWGVTVNMNHYIQAAYWVVKSQTTNPQAFQSGEKGYLGYVYENQVYRYNDSLYSIKLPKPTTFPYVEIIYDYPGSDGELLKKAVDLGAQAIAVEGMGAGNVNGKMFDAIKYAINKEVIVTISTNVANGCVFSAYGDKGGGASLVKEGVILGGNLEIDKVRLLLMLVMAEYGKDKEKIRHFLNYPFCRSYQKVGSCK
ncbi:MAG: L-asparaginase [Chlamydiae bacterium]|nr:L-asparaginase [Chlamydiota bacterium]